MSTTIDNRVVEMQFDNRQFERNVQTSMSTLEKLKQSLNLTGASKGLENINSAAKNVNLGVIGSAAETVGLKFNAMYTIADQVLRNITNRVQHTAESMVKALTLDPIKTGFQEYETQIGAVQTILANTSHNGTTLDQVNDALDTLNTYADKTIYNFTEMTRNIGTFTAAGVDLQTSVESIQGIANLAAVSGSTSQQASTAMYQLSQALAAGKVSLMDWNSVVNAGMGGKVFQDALVRTSELLGTGANKAIKAYGSFRESLTKGEWLTTEVLTETLKQFAGAYSEADLMAQGFSASQAKEIAAMAVTAENAATKVKTFTQLWDTLKEAAQSGWTQTWELIVGDFDESKEMLTGISEVVGEFINKTSETRNELLGGALNSPWKKFTEGLSEANVSVDSFQNTVRELYDSTKGEGAFDKLIEKEGSFEKACRSGKVSSDLLKNALAELGGAGADLSGIKENLKLGDSGEDVKKVQKALQNLGYEFEKFGADGVIGQETEEMIKKFQEMNGLEVTGIVDDATIAKIEEMSADTNKLSGNLGELIDSFDELGGREKLIESFKNIFKTLGDIIKPIKNAFREIFPPATSEDLISLIDKFKALTEKMTVSTETAGKIYNAFKGVFSVISFGIDIVKTIGSAFFSIASSLFGFSGSILDAASALGKWLSNVVESAKKNNILATGIEKITSAVTIAIDKIKEFGSSLTKKFKINNNSGIFGFFTSLWNIVKSSSLAIIDFLSSISTTIADAFGKGDIFEVFNSGLLTGIFFAITKFTKSLNDGFDGVGGILENVVGILDDVRGCFQAYQEQLKAGALMKIATAIALLAASIFVISTIDPEQLGKALGAITVLFVELLGSLAIFNKMGGTFQGAIKAIPLMLALSTSILILAGAMKVLSNISWEGIAKGLIGIGGLLAELFLFMKFAKFDKNMSKTALGIVLLSSALVILSKAVQNFAGVSWGGIAKGLVAVGALLAEVTVFSKFIGKSGNMITAGAGLVLLAASMKILASAIGEFATLSWGGIARGLVAMAGGLAAATLALNLIPKDAILRAAGLAVAAASLKILYDVLAELGSMTWEQMGKSIITLGGALKVLSIGLKAMSGTLRGSAALLVASLGLAVMAPVMKLLSGLEWAGIAKGLVAIAGAFAVFGIAGALLSPIIPALLGLSTAFLILGVGMVGIGAGLALIGVGISSLSFALSAGATSIVASLSTVILGILNLVPEIAEIIGRTIIEVSAILGDYAPQLAESLCKLIVGVVDSLATYTPQLVDSLLTLLIDVVNGLAEHTPTLIQAFVNLFAKVFEGIVIALNDLDTATLFKGVGAVGIMTLLAHALSGVAKIIPSAMKGLFGVGILLAELTLILAAIGGIAQIPGLKWLVTEGGDLLESVGNAIGRAIGSLIGGIGEGVSNSLPKIGENVAELMKQLSIAAENAKGIESGSFNGVSELIDVIGDIALATVGTTLSDIFTFGGTSMEKFQKDGVAFFIAMRQISNASAGISIDEESLDAILSSATKLSELQTSLEPIGGVVDWFTGRDDLSYFGMNAAAFISSMKTALKSLNGITFNSEALSAIISASKELSSLRSTLEPIGGVVDWFTGRNDLGTFGDNASEFISSMKTAMSDINGIKVNTEALSAIITASTELSKLQSSLDSVGGVIDWFTGRDDLGTFGDNASEFITSMSTAMSSLNGIKVNTEALSAIITASTELSKLQSSLDSVGGVIDWFTGRDDLGTFGFNAGAFILAMKTAMSSLDGVTINSEALSSIVTAATELSNLQSSLNSIGGVIDWFTGRDDLGNFGINAGAFILAMKLALGSLEGVTFNTDALSAIITASTELSKLQSKLEPIGGVIDWFAGRDNLGTFGFNAASFIRSMKNAMGSLDGMTFNTEAMTSIITASTELSKLQSTLEPMGGVIDWFTGRDDLGNFGINAGAFILAMKTAMGSLDGMSFNAEALGAIITASTELSKLQSTLEPIGGVIDWFIGRNDLGTFGLNAGAFIVSMKLALGSLDGVTFNTEGLSAIITASTELSKLQSTLEPIGGVIDWFIGRNDLGTFGLNAGAFILSMKYALSTLDGVTFNTEGLSAIITASTELSKLQSTIEPIGGVIDWFTGRDDLGTFGLNVGAFILSMKYALSNLDGVTFNTEGLNAIITASTELSKLQSSLDSVGGVIDWFTGRDDLGTFGLNASTFITAMADACTSLNGNTTINTEALGSIISAASELSSLQSSLDSLGGVIGFFTGEQNLGDFGTNASAFIKAMTDAFGALGDTTINSEAMSAVITAATELATLESSLNSIGGVIGFFTGEQNLGDFSTNIGLFAEAMGKLKDGMGENGISEDVVASVTNAGNALVELNNALPEEGFFDSKITMTEFSTYITDFSTAISDFSSKASEINSEGINTAINAAHRIKYLIDSVAGLDTSGVALFTGMGVGGVGADGAVYNIAEAIAAFSTKVSDIDTSAVSTATTAALDLKSLINGIVDIDTSGITSFSDVTKIGSAIGTYATNVGDIDTSIVSSSISAANRLKNFINSLVDLDNSGISKFKVGTIGSTLKIYAGNVAGVEFGVISSSVSAGNKLKNFINGLAGMNSSGVGTFTKAINDLGTVSIDKVIKAFSGASSKLKGAGSNMVEAITVGFKSKQTNLTTATTTAITAMIKNIDSKKAIFKVRGIELMSQLINGVIGQRGRLTLSVSSAVAAGATAARGYYYSFYSAGSYLVSGFCAGISANTWRATAQARVMANMAEQAAKEALGINSPSRVFAAIGSGVIEGFVKGIDDNMSDTSTAVRSMADVAREGFASAMSRIEAVLNSDMDMQPTITPVLDLSNVQAGAGSIDSMLGLGSTIGVNANVGAISTMMANRNQNGGNDDVVSAINKLGKSLGNIGGNTYNVNGVTYDDGSAVSDAIKTLIRASIVERRI